jgi:myosin heavy subunit
MSSSEKESQAKHERKTKAQLQKSLSNAHDVLEEQEKELNTLRKELKDAKAKITTLEKQQDQLDSTSTELQQARGELIEITQQVEQLKQEVEELNRVHQQDQEENESLRNQLQTIEKEEEFISLVEQLQKELQEAKQQEQEMRKKNRELEKTNAQLEKKFAVVEQTEEVTPQDMSVRKAAFHIDLYPRQGHFQGKIEHLLTKDKIVFKGLDKETIINFISKHIPQMEEESGAESQSTTTQTESMHSPIATIDSVLMPSLREIKIIPIGARNPTKTLNHEQPFRVDIPLDFTGVEIEKMLPLGYKAMIYAKPFGGGSPKKLGEYQDNITSTTHTISVDIDPENLSPGVYRIETVVNFSLSETEPIPVAVFQEKNMVQVY